MLAAWSVGTEWDWDSHPEPPCPDRSLHAMFRSAPGVSRSPPARATALIPRRAGGSSVLSCIKQMSHLYVFERGFMLINSPIRKRPRVPVFNEPISSPHLYHLLGTCFLSPGFL